MQQASRPEDSRSTYVVINQHHTDDQINCRSVITARIHAPTLMILFTPGEGTENREAAPPVPG
jgi:hypothetical protein